MNSRDVLINSADDSGRFAAQFEIIDKFIKLLDSPSAKIIKILAGVLESLMHKGISECFCLL